MKTLNLSPDLKLRLESRLLNAIEKDNKSGCWVWKRGCFKSGYGQVKWPQ
jgi:hypothetical protein